MFSVSYGPRVAGFSPLPVSFLDQPIFDHFRRAAHETPSKIATVDSTQSLTYDALYSHAASLAERLLECTAPDETIGILLDHSVDYVIAILGCLGADRTYVGLDKRYPRTRNDYIAEDSALRTFIVDSETPEIAIHPETRLVQLTDASSTDPSSKLSPSGTAKVVLYTSGSSGRPKRIANRQPAILHRAMYHVNAGHITTEDAFLPLSSLCTIAGIREAITAVISGAKLVLFDPERDGLRRILEVIEQEQVTIIYTVPAIMRAMISSGVATDALHSLRIVRLGGERILWSDIELLKTTCSPDCFFQVAYSSSESPGTQCFVPRDAEATGVAVPIGFALPGVDCEVVDDHGVPVAHGTEGELLIRSRFLADGVGSETEVEGVRQFRPGDVVVESEDGLLCILGRSDQQMKINGVRIEPAELEYVIRQDENVLETCIVVVGEKEDARLVAFAEVGEGADAESIRERLLKCIRTKLPHSLHPVRLHARSELPRLPSGKFDMVSLRAYDAECLREEVSPVVEEQCDALRAKVSRIWHSLLPSPVRGLTFQEAGGDSLRMLRFIFELEAAVGRTISFDTVHVEMTLDDCVRALSEGGEEVQEGSRPKIFLYPGLKGDSPPIAAFRRTLSPLVDIEVMKYPPWQEMSKGRNDLDTVVRYDIDRILAHEGPVHLAGYSYGAAVAYAAAKQLTEAGRNVEFFANLDLDVSGGAVSRAANNSKWQNKIRNKLGQFKDGESIATFKNLAYIITRKGMRRVTFALGRIDPSFLPTRLRYRSFQLSRELSEVMQKEGMRAWRRDHDWTQLEIDGHVFLSDEPRHSPPELGWDELLGTIEVHKVPGDHLGMLKAPHFDRTCDVFADCVRRKFMLSNLDAEPETKVRLEA